KEFERLAHDQKNAEHAERAAYYYDRAEKPLDKERMLAWRQYYQGEVLAAAHKMWSLDKALASDWFWEATLDSESARDELAGREVEPTWRRELARAYSHWRKQATDDAARSLLRKLEDLVLQRKVHESERHKRTWKVWNDLVLSLCKKLGQMTSVSSKSLELAYHLAAQIAPKEPYARDYKSWQNELARLSYRLERYGLAADHWEKAEETQHRDYFIAKAESSPYPLCLRWWDSAGDTGRVLLEYDKHPGVILEDPADRERVAKAAENAGRFLTAFQVLGPVSEDESARYWWTWLSSLHTDNSPIDAIQEALKGLRKISYPGLNRNKSMAEQWTRLLFRLILDSDERRRSEVQNTSWFDQVIHALVWGFGLGNDPEALPVRFYGSWRTRTETFSNWPKFRDLLLRMISSALKWNREIFQVRDETMFSLAANLALWALHLVWRIEKRRAPGPQKSMPEHATILRDYF
ncbi:MAG: hypothetical protein RMJ19_01100, partial [Gemmatales bacterium]|nr:hypothetical protein [Gemmatales bacterium]MDW8174243.1 hypothetical protein [Gemmatales bacterium]